MSIIYRLSKHRDHTQHCLRPIAAATLLLGQLALPSICLAVQSGSSIASTGSSLSSAASAVHAFQPELFTGRAATSIPIIVPPGRRGIQPQLALSYSSGEQNGPLGVGWSLDVGYIEQNTTHGVPRYDDADTYSFMFLGMSSDLVKIPDGTYRAKDEGSFLKFVRNSTSGWEVYDTSGTLYIFGKTSLSRIDDPTLPNRTFRWALEKVIDTNGNNMSFTYFKDQAQLYLLKISYTGHESITTPGSLNQVEFVYADGRPDHEITYRSGFSVTTTKRLRTIETKVKIGMAWSLARKYELGYVQSGLSARSLLVSIVEVGSDGTTALPALAFNYVQTPPSYLHCHNCVPPLTAGNNGWQLQFSIAHLFPKDDGGNDQRLWPNGSWEPGVKRWSEKVCRRRLFGTSCHEEPRSTAISPLQWSDPQLPRSGSTNGVTWNTDAKGNLSLTGPQDTHILAITWLYTSTPKLITLSGLTTNGRIDMFFTRLGETTWRLTSGNQISLAPGWTMLGITAYNELGAFSLNMSTDLASQVSAMNHNQFSPMSVVGDFNGDGLADLAHLEPSSNRWHVVLNSLNGFGQNNSWLDTALTPQTVPLVGDADADGRSDLVLWDPTTGAWQLARSNGKSFGTPVNWLDDFGKGTIPLVGDFNGDQLLDVATIAPDGTWRVCLSRGAGFSAPRIWLQAFGAGAAPLIGDFNGDGLTDIAANVSGNVSVALSNGTQFLPQPSWTAAVDTTELLTSADVNGDGLTDIMRYDHASGTILYRLSIGIGFAQAKQLLIDHPFTLRDVNDVLQVGDFRGTGLAGFGVFNNTSGLAQIAVAVGYFPDLLNTITNGFGAKVTVDYGSSSQLDNNFLPFTIPVVSAITTSDGRGHDYRTMYSYSGGLYDIDAHEFRGFATVRATDAISTVSETQFLQDVHMKGRILVQQTLDANGRLFMKLENAWTCHELYPQVHFTTLDQIDRFIFDGDASFRQSRTRLQYDSFGNVVRKDEDGWVRDVRTTETGSAQEQPTSGDERTTVTTYVPNLSSWILNKPRSIRMLDTTGATITQTRFLYDGAENPETAPTKGNLTREEEWLDVPDIRWVTTMLTYDSYGNLLATADGGSPTRRTLNAYDDSGTYIREITNALGHSWKFSHDPRTGAVTSSVDQNSQQTTTEYDPVGRVLKIIGPNDSSTYPTTRYQYDPLGSLERITTCLRVQSTSAPELCTYTFLDGLGRLAQTRQPAADSRRQVVIGAVESDARGLIIKQWPPYFDNPTTSFVPHTTIADLPQPSLYSYDPIGRPILLTAPDRSTTTLDYDDGETTTTDANKNQVQHRFDAYGRLARVDEILSETERYTTMSTYDGLDRLVAITDTNGHAIHMAYDSLGRKIALQDPDMGHWSYRYDDSDNLIQQTDARGVSTAYTYDELNRLTRKTSLAPVGSSIPNSGKVSYTYDTSIDAVSPYSKGKLSSIVDNSGTSQFVYDKHGRLTEETRLIEGTRYRIVRTYDLLGRITSVTYPDGDIATYTYNPQGGISSIHLKTLDGSIRPIIKGMSYDAIGRLTGILYGNELTTQYRYNTLTQQLTSLTTRTPQGIVLQDLSYLSDPIGNITRISNSTTGTAQSFKYDALSRLIEATGASYGTLTYQHDAMGNMLEMEGLTMCHGSVDQTPLHAITGISSGITLSYDANGNLLKKQPSHSDLISQLFLYDTDNRLVQVETPEEDSVTLTFAPGWNFFSLPIVPDNPSIASLFTNFSRDFEQLARFDAATNTFTHHVGNSQFDDFATLEYGSGYQVYCRNPNGVVLTIKGKTPTTALSEPLSAGWHLLPALTLSPEPITQQFRGIAIDSIFRYNTSTSPGFLTAADSITPGEAYYVKVRTTSEWTPDLPRSATCRFVYDGDGGRSLQQTATGSTLFLGPSYEIAFDGTRIKYIFAGSRRVAQIATPPAKVANAGTTNGTMFSPRISRITSRLLSFLWMAPPAEAASTTSTIHFFLPDHLGSTHLLTDERGSVIQELEYMPYGKISPLSSIAAVEHQFTGQRYDASIGLYYYHARYYDPSLAQFIQPDPLTEIPANSQTLNRYAYVRYNPVNRVDPSGNFSFRKWFQSLFSPKAIAQRTLGTVVATGTRESVSQAARTIEQAGVSPSHLSSIIAAAPHLAIGDPAGTAIIFGTTLAAHELLDTREGQGIVRRVAKEFFDDVIGMTPRAAYVASAVTLETAAALTLETAAAIVSRGFPQTSHPTAVTEIPNNPQGIWPYGPYPGDGRSQSTNFSMTTLGGGRVVIGQGRIDSGVFRLLPLPAMHTGASAVGSNGMQVLPGGWLVYGTYGVCHTCTNITALKAGYSNTVITNNPHWSTIASTIVYGNYGGGLIRAVGAGITAYREYDE